MEKREQRKKDYLRRSDPRWEWAEERTEWAEERTLMAKERTVAAWMRTGLAMAATGLGFGQLLRQMEPAWAVKAMAGTMVLAAMATFVLGYWRHHKISRQLEYSGLRRTPLWTLASITIALIGASLLGLLLIVV